MIDWSAVASVIAERHNLPVALLDGQGTVKLVNSAMERLLGWDRFEAEGRQWCDLAALSRAHEGSNAHEGDACRHLLAQAMRGALTQYELRTANRAGQTVTMEADLSLVGEARQQGLLITAKRALTTYHPAAIEAQLGVDYVVSLAADSWAHLLEATTDQAHRLSLANERRCFAVLYQEGRPCENCPLVRPENLAEGMTSTRVRKVDLGGDKKIRVEMTTVKQIERDTAHMHVRFLNERDLSDIHEAKLSHVAGKGCLTEREIDVFRYLVMGRSIEDISVILDIAPRTVKYHQANVLQKLGADSRADLSRLLI